MTLSALDSSGQAQPALRSGWTIQQVQALFLALVFFCLPFNGINGPQVLRELSVEASIYPLFCFLLATLSLVATRLLSDLRVLLLLLAVPMMLLLNYMLAYDDISVAMLGEISGSAKFVNSTLVFLLYVYFAFAVFAFLRTVTLAQIAQFVRRVVHPLVVFLVIIWIIEVVSWYIDPLRELITPIKRFVSTGPYFAKGRLSGVSFEPSFNSIVMVGLLPALWFGALYRGNSIGERQRYALFGLLFIIFGTMSDSRTAYLIMLAQLLLLVGLYLFGTRVARMVSLAVILPLAIIVAPPVFLYTLGGDLSGIAGSTNRISDITRLTAVNAAIDMWTRHPYGGVGFGQYGFYYRSAVNYVSTLSWEVNAFLGEARADEFPPSYSLYWRILAETGIVGFTAFYGVMWSFFVGLARAMGIRRLTRDETNLILATAIGLAGALLIGVSFDSYRTPFIWIYAGMAAAVPTIIRREVRRRKLEAETASASGAQASA